MSSIESVIFYLVMFSVSALLFWYAEKRERKPFKIISLLIPIVIGSIRFDVGTDYHTYVSLFNNAINQSFEQYMSNGPTEIGFYILSKISHLISGNEIFLFSIFSFITVYFFYLGIKNYDIGHKALIYFLFLVTIFPGSFNIMRQAAAASICFYAFSLLLNKRVLRFFFWMALAVALHTSALITIPVYLLTYLVNGGKTTLKKISFLKLLRTFTPALILLIALPFLFTAIEAIGLLSRYERYEDIVVEGSNYTFILKLAILLIILLAVGKLVRSKADLSFLSLSSVDVVLTLLGFVAAPIKRIGMYFSPFPLLLLPKYIDLFSDRLGKFLCYALLISYGVAFFYVSFYILNQAEILPYKTFLGGIS